MLEVPTSEIGVPVERGASSADDLFDESTRLTASLAAGLGSGTTAAVGDVLADSKPGSLRAFDGNMGFGDKGFERGAGSS